MQTAQRGEVIAALMAAKATKGPLVIITDSQYTRDTIIRGSSAKGWSQGPRADLWNLFWEGTKGREIQAKWVKAHTKLDEIEKWGLTKEDWQGTKEQTNWQTVALKATLGSQSV